MMTYHSSFIKRGYLKLRYKFKKNEFFYANVEYIQSIQGNGDDGSIVDMTNGKSHYVIETPEQILDAIKEIYK